MYIKFRLLNLTPFCRNNDINNGVVPAIAVSPIFLWNFAHMLYVVIPANLYTEFFVLFFTHKEISENLVSWSRWKQGLFTCFLRSTDSENLLFSSHFFVGMADKNTCAKFQRKTINSTESELLEILILLNSSPFFWWMISPIQKQM